MGILLLSGLLLSWIVCSCLNNATGALTAASGGCVLSWFFVGSGFVGFYKARAKPETAFQRIFLSSIFIRLAIMVVIIVFILKYTVFGPLPFFISLFCCYFIFQIWEVVCLNRLVIGK
jgi:hypothetical protein